MRVEVLYGLEDACPLPLPAVQLFLVVPAVALPEGDVATLQSLGSMPGSVRACYQLITSLRCPAGGLIPLSLALLDRAEGQRNLLFNAAPIGYQGYLAIF